MWCYWVAVWDVCVFFRKKKKGGAGVECVCACCMCLCIPKATSHRPWLWNINIISNSSLAAKSPMHYTMYVCARLGQVLHQWANEALPTSHSPLSHSPLSSLLSLLFPPLPLSVSPLVSFFLISQLSILHSLFPFLQKSKHFLCPSPSNALLFGLSPSTPLSLSPSTPSSHSRAVLSADQSCSSFFFFFSV